MEATKFSLFRLSRTQTWYIQYTDSEGVRRQKSTRCVRKAEAYLKLSEFKQWISRQSITQSPTFSSFVAEYTRHITAVLQPSTVRSYTLAFRNFLRVMGDLPLDTLTPRHWDLFKTRRLTETRAPRHRTDREDPKAQSGDRTDPLSPMTVNVELRALRACIGTAVRWQLLAKNPFERLHFVSIPRRRPQFLSIAEAELLLATIKKETLKNIIIVALNTGMRAGELLSLRWQDINMDRRLALITNRKDFRTKTGEERIVIFNDAAMGVVERQRSLSRGDYLFSDRKGHKYSESYISHQFKKMIRRAGLSEDLHFHSLRHTFASLLVGYGTSIYAVSKLLGHASVKTSEIYSHLLPSSLGSEVSKLGIGLDVNSTSLSLYREKR